MTKKLNWEILIKNSILLKNEMWLRIKNFNIMKCSLKNSIFWEEIPKKPRYKGELPKKRKMLGQLPDLRRDLAKKRGWCF